MSSYEFKCLWKKHLTKIGRLQIVTEPLWRPSAYFPKDLFNVSFHIFCEIILKQTCSVYFQGHTFIWVRAACEILKVMKCIVIIPEREVQMSTHKKTLIFRMFSRTHCAFWKFLSYNTSAVLKAVFTEIYDFMWDDPQPSTYARCVQVGQGPH